MSEQMTSRERCLATIRLQPHDRVPVDLHNFMMTLAGVKLTPDVFRNGPLLGEAQVATWKRFGHDLLIVENGTASLAEACGCQVDNVPNSAPAVTRPLISSLSEVSRLKKPDPWNSPLTKAALEATRLVLDRIGDQALVMGRADQSPFSLACMILGMEPLMEAMGAGDHDDQIFELLEYTTDCFILYAQLFRDMGCPVTSAGEAQGSVMSPRMYEKYCLPYMKKAISALQCDDFFVAYHICGNSTKIVDRMVSSEAAILELDYKTDKNTAKTASAGKTTLLGPIDPSSVLHEGSVEDVERACREAIAILAPGGGYILGPGCALPLTTPPENIDKLIECAKLYGSYCRAIGDHRQGEVADTRRPSH